MSDTAATDPNAMMSGADILVQCLANEGVDTIFAYPGGASMPIHQSLTRFVHRIRTILPRHEQGGGFMAHGYAHHRQGGRLHEHVWPWRDELRHLHRRCEDGQRSPHCHHRTSADDRARQ